MQSLGIKPADVDSQKDDRRRCVRHKAHLPAYVTVNGSATAPAFDFSEILDISEDGMSIQTSVAMQPGQKQMFALDLSRHRELIHATARIVWIGPSHRVGVQFEGFSQQAQTALKDWLDINEAALSAVPETSAEPSPNADSNNSAIFAAADSPAHPDYTLVLAALEAVKREIHNLGPELDACLRLIADRAQTFTRSTGAALALTEGAGMVCRASAGPDAPPAGAKLTVGSGFSGECVRTGKLLRCDDSELDPRVDAAKARVLGIRSMLAVPIHWDASIIGLLEVFSPDPDAFGPDDELVLPRLAAIAATAVHRAGSPDERPPKPAVIDDEFPVETPADLPLPQLARSRNGLLLASAATILFVVIWLVAPWNNPEVRRPATSGPASTAVIQPTSPSGSSGETADLRRLADQGDPAAQFAIGARYATGEDVPQDYVEAVRWFNKAADQGNVAAQATLGAYYWAGRGVSTDLPKAYFWSLLAEAGGDEASKSRVALLASRLNRGQILAAQQQANDWIAQHQAASKTAPIDAQ